MTRQAWRWLAAHPWTMSLILVALVTSGAGVVLAEQDARQGEFAECVARWADATADRSSKLGTARAGVDAANDDLWRTFDRLLDQPAPDAKTQFQQRLDSYVAASDAYRDSAQDNPPPPPPRLGCG